MKRDNRGMTLIEILIALTILTIVSVALLQSALLAMSTNVQNELRDEAVRVVEQRMNELRNRPFTASDMLATSPSFITEPAVTRNIRAVARSYTIKREISDIVYNNITSKQVTLTVTWSYKNQQYQHSVSTVLREP